MSHDSSRRRNVGRVCNGQVISIDVDDTLLDAAQMMVYKRVGALAVLEKGTLVGIVSEADIVSAVVEQVPMATTYVRDYMTEAPITVSTTDEADLAARYMLEHEVSHLPVMESGEAVGMLSTGDLLALGAVPATYRSDDGQRR